MKIISAFRAGPRLIHMAWAALKLFLEIHCGELAAQITLQLGDGGLDGSQDSIQFNHPAFLLVAAFELHPASPQSAAAYRQAHRQTDHAGFVELDPRAGVAVILHPPHPGFG